MPGTGRWHERPTGAFEDGEDVPFELLPILAAPHTGTEFLCDDDTQSLERRERPVEALDPDRPVTNR